MIDEQTLLNVANAYKEYGSQRLAAKALGIPRRTFRNYLDKFNSDKYNIDPGFKITKISKTLDRNGNVSGQSIVSKLAPDRDFIKRDGKVVRRSTLYGSDGAVVGEWVIRKPEDEERETFLSALDDSFKANVSREPVPQYVSNADLNSEDASLFMSIDEHLNVRLLQDMCGKEYGLESATSTIMKKFYQMVNRTPVTDTAYFVNLGDQFHANDHMNVTPASKHVLDVDRSTFETSKAAIELTRWKIDYLLSRYNHVEVHGVAGNHDIDPMGWLFRCLEIAYENNPRVHIEFHPDEMFAIQHGQTFLGFHHGHKIKPDAMAGAMADRFSKLYGDTQFRYIHTGHVHHDAVKDVFGGFKWHSHRTIIPKDWYSVSHGYVSRRSMKSYIYNEYEGEVANLTTSIGEGDYNE